MGWIRGKNGREMVNEEHGCAQSGGSKGKRKTVTEMGGL